MPHAQKCCEAGDTAYIDDSTAQGLLGSPRTVSICNFAGLTTFSHMWHIVKSFIVPYLVFLCSRSGPPGPSLFRNLCLAEGMPKFGHAHTEVRPFGSMQTTFCQKPFEHRTSELNLGRSCRFPPSHLEERDVAGYLRRPHWCRARPTNPLPPSPGTRFRILPVAFRLWQSAYPTLGWHVEDTVGQRLLVMF